MNSEAITAQQEVAADYGKALRAAARIIDPLLGDVFDGTRDEAVTVIAELARTARYHFGDDDEVRSRLASMMVRAQVDRVMEIMAAVLVAYCDMADRAEVAEGKLFRVEQWIDDDPGGYNCPRYDVAELIGYEV